MTILKVSKFEAVEGDDHKVQQFSSRKQRQEKHIAEGMKEMNLTDYVISSIFYRSLELYLYNQKQIS